jgi:hypothetical protein
VLGGARSPLRAQPLDRHGEDLALARLQGRDVARLERVGSDELELLDDLGSAA